MKQISNANNTGKNVLYLVLPLSICAILFNACKVSIPMGAKVVKPFDSKRYLGKWYEIALILNMKRSQ
jgi:apolipoprotein D and lipocalin family protein